MAEQRALTSALNMLPAPVQTVVSGAGVTVMVPNWVTAVRWRAWADSQPFPVTVLDAADLIAGGAA